MELNKFTYTDSEKLATGTLNQTNSNISFSICHYNGLLASVDLEGKVDFQIIAYILIK